MFYGSTLYGQSPYATMLKKKARCSQIGSNGNLIQLSTPKFSKKPNAFTPKEQC